MLPRGYYAKRSCLLQLDTATIHSCLTYATSSLGTRHSSVLNDNVSLEEVLGRHDTAAQHLDEAIRDAVKERLAVVLGRRKGRPLDLDLLHRLPATELVEACRQARLPISDEEPPLLAVALHQWLHAPEVAQTTAARPRSGTAGAMIRTGGWDRPASLRHSNWLHRPGSEDPADTDSARDAILRAGGAAVDVSICPSVGPALSAVTKGHRNTTVSVLATAVADRDADAEDSAAEAALRAEAERQADLLFDEELQRRLHRATAAAASVETGDGGTIDGGCSKGNASITGELQIGLQQQQQQKHQYGREALELQMEPVMPAHSSAQPLRPSSPLPPLQQQQKEPVMHSQRDRVPQQPQQQQHLADHHREPLFLSTTELLVAASQSDNANLDFTSSSGFSHRVIGSVAESGSLFDLPPPLTGPPRPSEVVAAVRRSLGRAGYHSKSPTALRSLLLLSRGELLRLVESFTGGGLDSVGKGREQLAARLLDMMNSTSNTPESNSSSSGGSSSSDDSSPSDSAKRSKGASVEAAAEDSGVTASVHQTQADADAAVGVGVSGAVISPVVQEQAQTSRGDRRRSVTWLHQEMRLGGSEGGEEWDDERAALGDSRRRQVLEAVRRRQQLMAAAAQPDEVAMWLVKARAQDVVVISSDPESRRDVDSDPGSRARAFHHHAAPSSPSYVVVATALSQRHAYACAEAVRYQIRERLEDLVSRFNSASSAVSGIPKGSPPHLEASVLGAPSVSGFNGADWLSLEAGRVQVHVLTPQARRYYRLEELQGGMSSGHGLRTGSSTTAISGPGSPWSARGQPPARPRIRMFGPLAAGERPPETLETARVEAVTEH